MSKKKRGERWKRGMGMVVEGKKERMKSLFDGMDMFMCNSILSEHECNQVRNSGSNVGLAL